MGRDHRLTAALASPPRDRQGRFVRPRPRTRAWSLIRLVVVRDWLPILTVLLVVYWLAPWVYTVLAVAAAVAALVWLAVAVTPRVRAAHRVAVERRQTALTAAVAEAERWSAWSYDNGMPAGAVLWDMEAERRRERVR